MTFIMLWILAAAQPALAQASLCTQLFAGVLQADFSQILNEIDQATEKEVDHLLAAARFKGSEVDYKYSAFLQDEKPREQRRYIATYTTTARGQDIVVQLVRKSTSSSLEEKRRVLKILSIHKALKAHGLTSLLLGFAEADELRPQFLKHPEYWEFADADGDAFSFAMVSQDLKFAANFKTRWKASAVLSKWPPQTMARAVYQITEVENVLRQLRLTGQDLQYLVTDEGQVILVQLDRLQADQGHPIRLEADRTLLRDNWRLSQLETGWITLPHATTPPPPQSTLTGTPEEILKQGTAELAESIKVARSDLMQSLSPLLHHRISFAPQVMEDVNLSGRGLGGCSHGVVSIRVDNEKQVIKIAAPPLVQGDLRAHPGFGDAIHIQRVLGRMGYALQLHEVYVGDGLKDLIRELNWITGDKRIPLESSALRYGLRLEEIPRAWVYDRAPDTPAFFREWGREQLTEAVARIRELEEVLTGLRVMAADGQIFISKDARVILGDLDFYRMNPLRGPTDFTFLVYDLLNRWEERFGEDRPDRLTNAERARYLLPNEK